MIDVGLIQKAINLAQQGKFEEAGEIYANLLKDYPDDYNLLSCVGLYYVQTKDYIKASEYLEKACSIKETFGTVSALGLAEYERGNYGKAALFLEKSLEYGENVDIYNKLCNCFFDLECYKKAVEYSEKMFERYPDDIRAITNKIKALTQSGSMLEAESLCIETLKKDPMAASSLWLQLGYLKELIYHDDMRAVECYKAATELDNPNGYYNMAVSYQKLENYELAEKYFKKMLEFFPDDRMVKIALGMCYMAQKKFKEGYDLFFLRDKEYGYQEGQNGWQPGDELSGEVVVLCDQGLGDHIQFARYLPILAEKVDKIYLASRLPLKTLFEKNYPFTEFIESKDVDLKMKALRICDLAYILNLDFDHIPFAEGYLNSETAEIKSDKLKVGLCWEAGAAGIRTMINRTINVKSFEPVLNLEGVQFYSLQCNDTFNGVELYPQMIDLAKDLKDFSDTAKAIKAMDVVVTVDTSVAHLAGALGVKTFLLLPYATDWRWFKDRKRTPWYDSVEIFKQTNSLCWDEQMKEIAEKLNSLKN